MPEEKNPSLADIVSIYRVCASGFGEMSLIRSVELYSFCSTVRACCEVDYSVINGSQQRVQCLQATVNLALSCSLISKVPR